MKKLETIGKLISFGVSVDDEMIMKLFQDLSDQEVLEAVNHICDAIPEPEIGEVLRNLKKEDILAILMKHLPLISRTVGEMPRSFDRFVHLQKFESVLQQLPRNVKVEITKNMLTCSDEDARIHFTTLAMFKMHLDLMNSMFTTILKKSHGLE